MPPDVNSTTTSPLAGPAPYRHPGFGGQAAVARRDITPSLDVRARCWGPAAHDLPAGVHRPLTVTVLALRAPGDEPLVLVSADLSWWRRAEDEAALRERVLAATGLAPERLLVHLVHTHAGPTLSTAETDLPGGDRVAAYLDGVADAIVAATREALDGLEPAILEVHAGWCGVAATRDVRVGATTLTGFDPDGAPDGTLVVGRVCAPDGRVRATLVNYACHPTTLGWENALLSPDWVGAAREVVESATGAPALVLQGASGELAPREQYVGDIAVADRHGRAIGHAAVATLEAMLPAGSSLELAGTVQSGAPLAMWERRPRTPPSDARARRVEVELELKPPVSEDELRRRWSDLDERSLQERLVRATQLRAPYGDAATTRHPLWAWRLGEVELVAHPGEAYSHLQRALRRRGPVLVLNLTNGPGFMYLPPAALYETDAYPAWQTLYAAGSLERLTGAAEATLDTMECP